MYDVQSFVLCRVTSDSDFDFLYSEILLFIFQELQQFVQMVKACVRMIIWRGKKLNQVGGR